MEIDFKQEVRLLMIYDNLISFNHTGQDKTNQSGKAKTNENENNGFLEENGYQLVFRNRKKTFQIRFSKLRTYIDIFL